MARETIPLQYPVTVAGETIAELHLRRPKMGDMKRAQKFKDDLERSIRIIADLAEVTPETVEELDPVDFKVVTDKVGEFMGASEG